MGKVLWSGTRRDDVTWRSGASSLKHSSTGTPLPEAMRVTDTCGGAATKAGIGPESPGHRRFDRGHVTDHDHVAVGPSGTFPLRGKTARCRQRQCTR